MNIYLVRHGENEDNAAGILNGRRDLPLTALGKEQSLAVAIALAKRVKKIDAIYSSPLLRARQTAEVIADKTGVKDFIVEDDLIERDYGILTGKSRTDIPKYSSNNIQVGNLLYFLNAADAESFPDTYLRAQRLLKEIEKSRYATVIMVGHRDICVMIQAAFYEWGWEEGLRKAHMDNADVLKLG